MGNYDRSEMNNAYSKRDYLLPEGCQDLADVLKLEAQIINEIHQPLHTRDEIRQVMRRPVPEIAAGTVEIVSISRDQERRCCVAVRSQAPKVSPVDACTGERGTRIKAIIRELGGEPFTIVGSKND
jgi:transcription antitermination factor NusA-like protein